MSEGRSDTSSKRKRSTPQKFKSRKLFASSRHDILEQSEFSPAKDGGASENQLSLSKLPVTLQNKENMPEKYPNGSVTSPRGRGRPKGSKNKTFPTLPNKVYDVREGKSPVYTSKPGSDTYSETPDSAVTPQRGRGRPKGSTKVKQEGEDTPRRSRGRPKGSKNKKPSKAALLKMLTSGEKIGKGRPRKTPHPNEANVSLTPKRGRGRPKGSLNKTPSVKRLPLTSGTHEVKKRGRPKKITLHRSTPLTSLTPKRPRGRPRKKGNFSPSPLPSQLPSQDNEETSQLSVTSENFAVKKRGRPRKHILNHPTTLVSLTPTRPRGRPRKNSTFTPEPSQDQEVKSSESNTEDEEDNDSEDDDNDNDNDNDDDEDK